MFDFIRARKAKAELLESAVEYVRDYFAKVDGCYYVMTGRNRVETVDGMHIALIGIRHVPTGHVGTFDVWNESGALYGEF